MSAASILAPPIPVRPAAAGRSPYVPALEGVRGLAVVIVLLGHASGMGLCPWPDFTGVARYGVFLFFVLSAYLLTDQCLVADDGRFPGKHFWLNYFLRRTLRIYPLFTVVLLADFAAVRWGVIRPPVEMATSFTTLTALARQFFLVDGVDVFWTVSVEFKFYLLLPIVVLVMAGPLRNRLGWVTAAVAGAIMVMRAVARPKYGPHPWAFLQVFLLGCWVAAVGLHLRRRASPQWLRPAAEAAGWASLAGYVLLIPALWARLSGHAFIYDGFHLWFLTLAGLWTAVLLAVLHGAGGLRRAFEFGPLRFAGRVSFSVYLWHRLIFFAFIPATAAWPEPARTLVAVAIVFPVAAVSYRLVERPLARVHLKRPATPS